MLAIYTLCDPATGEVRYLGMSRNPAYRLRQYKARTGGHTKHLRNWLESVGRNPAQIILETVSAEIADQCERAWITLLRSYGTRLINCTDGGEGGYTQSAEHKARLRELQLAAIAAGTHNFLQPANRALVAANRKGRPQPWSRINLQRATAACRGRKLTDEHKQKCSVALTGKKKSPESRAQIAARVRQQWADPAWAAKMRAALTGIPRDLAGLRAFNATRRGVPLSAAHRAAVSAAMKGRRNPGLVAYWESRKALSTFHK